MAALDTSLTVSPASAAVSSLTVPPPACTAGNLLVMTVLGVAGGGVIANTPPGWARQSAAGAPLAVFTKTATAPESPYTVSFPSPCAAVVQVASYPAATATFSSASSSAGVTSWSPAFPGGVATDQVVVLCAGVVTTATGTFAESTSFRFPSSWAWDAPPIGPQFLNGFPAGVTGTAVAGMASVTGPQSAPALSSVQKTQFYAGYLVLTITATEPPWLRVTASAVSAGAAHSNVGQAGAGMVLTVKALTGADTPANIASGGTVLAAASGVTQVTLTPKRSGSLVYGAASSNAATAAYAADPGTTFSQNVHNTTNGVQQAYGTFGAGPVTAKTAVTTGASGPAAGSVNIAAAEILATSALTELATAQAGALAPADYAVTPAAQTAIFTSLPAAGTVMVAMVAWAQGDSTLTVTVSDDSGMVWTELARANGAAAGYAGVWVAQFGAPGGPPGVPTGLQVTGATDSSVTLAWTAPAQGPVTGYDVFADGLKTATSAGTSVTVGGLPSGTTFLFSVDAWNAAGVSSQTSAVQGSTEGGPPPPPQSTGSGCMFGLRPVPAAGVSPETAFQGSVIARELLLGRKLDLVTTWRNWDPATENTTAEGMCLAGGRIPMLTWPLPANVPAGGSAGITAGSYDQVIYGWGQRVGALGGRVLFRPMPDANADANFGPAPGTYVTSWQRIWTILKGSPAQFAALSPACTAGPALSLANVEFVWSMAQRGTAAGGGNLWASYFPGTGYVDWIALSAYVTSPAAYLDTLITSGDYVSTSSSHNWYATYAGLRKPSGAPIPLMISETGCREADDPGVTGQPFSKAAWLTQAAGVLASYPAVRAVVYTDAALPPGDWRIDTIPGPPVTSDSPAANPTLAAVISWAGAPYSDRRMRLLAGAGGNLYPVADQPGT